MAIDSKVLHALAHTVRMRQVIAETPEHGRAGEYERQMAIYKLQWLILTPAQRSEIVDAAHDLPGMTPKEIASAVTALEA